MKRKKGYFSISAVAEMFSVHQQTLRFYEKEGLITPKRSKGNTRLFSEEDVNELEQIIYLTHQLGINLAGVQMVVKLQKKIMKLQKELNKAFDEAQDELKEETTLAKQIAQSSAQRLLMIKQKHAKIVEAETPTPADEPTTQEDTKEYTIDPDGWELEYDDE
jgi:MerR family transcriptional regulator, heat shock protein HspR